MTAERDRYGRLLQSLANLRDEVAQSISDSQSKVATANRLILQTIFIKLLDTIPTPYENTFFNEVRERIVSSKNEFDEFARILQHSVPELVSKTGSSSHSSRQSILPSICQQSYKIPNIRLNDAVVHVIDKIDGIQLGREESDFVVDPRVRILGMLFETLQHRKRRRRKGIYYTPPSVAKIICESAFRALNPFWYDEIAKITPNSLHEILNLRLLDNACGSGIFLIEALEIIIKTIEDQLTESSHSLSSSEKNDSIFQSRELLIQHIISNCLFGVDLENFAIDVSEAQLWLIMAAHRNSSKDMKWSGANLIVADSLLASKIPNGVFDIIVGNPPYIRLSSFPQEYKARIREEYPVVNEFNLHALFVMASLRKLIKGGVLGYLVHKNLLGLDSFSKLRRELLQNCECVQIASCGTKLFPGVTAETGIIIVRNQTPSRATRVRLSQLNRESPNLEGNFQITQDEYMHLVQAWKHRFIATIGENDFQVLKRIHDFPRLGEKVSIRRGIETGSNAQFLSNHPKQTGNWLPILRGKDVAAFRAVPVVYINYNRESLSNPGPVGLDKMPKVVLQQNAKYPIASYDSGNSFVLNSATYLSKATPEFLKAICTLLNSNFIAWFFQKVITNEATVTVNVLPNNLALIPLPFGLDTQLFSCLCDIQTKLRHNSNKQRESWDAFWIWHSLFAEAIVYEAYMKKREKNHMTRAIMPWLSKRSLPIEYLASVANNEDLFSIAQNVLKSSIIPIVE